MPCIVLYVLYRTECGWDDARALYGCSIQPYSQLHRIPSPPGSYLAQREAGGLVLPEERAHEPLSTSVHCARKRIL